MRSTAKIVALAAADVGLLWTMRPAPGLGAALAHPGAWFARVGADVACAQLAGAALWIAAAWLGLGLAASAATRLPGSVGRSAAVAARILLPRTVRAVLIGSAGLGVVLAPIAAGATPGPGRAAVSAGADALHGGARVAVTIPTPTWPVDPAPHHPAPHQPAPHHPAHPVHPHHPRTATARNVPNSPGATGNETAGGVTVHRGDSLWLIAARRVGPQATPAQIARAWPRWYAANRSVIGADPAVIAPGQVLRAPKPHRTAAHEEG